MLSMNGSVISHNVDALLCASYKSIYFANIHDIFIQNSMETHIYEK